MLEGIIESKSKSFLGYCFSFLLGVAFISVVDVRFDLVFLYGGVFVLLGFLVSMWDTRRKRFFVLCVLFFVSGVGRYVVAFPADSSVHISYYNEQKHVVVGHVVAEPDVRMDGVRYIVHSQSFIVNGGEEKTRGRIYLKSRLYPRYQYGDVLEIECHLKTPEPIEDFEYDKYLARFGVFSICAGPRIKKVGDGKGNVVLRNILKLKVVVAERINELWHEPHASFMAGLLYGYRGGLGSLNEKFSRTGVTHIVAISGYNITIVATILITFCVHILIPRKRAFWVVSTGIVLFVLFAGASASVVRAGIMGVIVLLARQVGRISGVGNVLVLTAVIMTVHNPFILMYDAGFQLSFLSTVGLVYITPLIQHWFSRVPEALGIRESVVSTLAATIITLPLILYQFGRLSIVAILVNVLILWIIPFIMLAGFFAVFASVVFEPVGQVLSWVAWAGLQYIIIIVEFFSDLSFAAVDIRVPWWVMFGMYVVLGFWIIRKNKVQKNHVST